VHTTQLDEEQRDGCSALQAWRRLGVCDVTSALGDIGAARGGKHSTPVPFACPKRRSTAVMDGALRSRAEGADQHVRVSSQVNKPQRSPLQGGGRRFEPCSAHDLTSAFASPRPPERDGRASDANRLQTETRG
jgi:hypothetical protein